MEPTSSAAGGIAVWKLAGASAMVAGLAAIVVMCIKTPRTPQEWAIGLISTVICSICGGAGVIYYFGLQSLMNDVFGIVAILGLVFTCGLPGWAIVRWVFNAIHKREGQGIDEVIKEVRNGKV